MSGSQQLGPACLSVACSIRWSVPPADEKYLWKTTSTQTVASCLCWCVEPHFFSHLLLDQQKDEYLCSFLEVVPRLVTRHLLQPVFRLVLRLLLWILFFFLLQIVFKIAGLRTWFRIGVSNQNFTDGFLVKFYFFPGHCSTHAQRSALFTLLCVTGHS